MRKKSLDFLKNILANPSPSGFEQPVQKLWHNYTKPFAQVRTDTHGNTIGIVNPKGSPRIMFAGHCDEIGFMIKYIDEKGFLYFGSIGGFDETIIPGRRVTIHTSHGPVNGVIGKTPIHLIKSDDRRKGSEIKDLWIDIGVKDKKEAEKLVTIGTLTAGVAHEINNPNNALMLSLQSHEQTWKELQPVLDSYAEEHGDFEVGGYLYSELKEEMPESLHRASMNSERIKKIVEDLRSFARKDEGALDEDVNINTVVENALGLVGNVIRKKTRNLKITYEVNMPTASEAQPRRKRPR